MENIVLVGDLESLKELIDRYDEDITLIEVIKDLKESFEARQHYLKFIIEGC